MTVRITAPAVIVEPSLTGSAFVVTPRPRYRALERAFPLAWQALEHADLLADELQAKVIDRTEVRA